MPVTSRRTCSGVYLYLVHSGDDKTALVDQRLSGVLVKTDVQQSWRASMVMLARYERVQQAFIRSATASVSQSAVSSSSSSS